MREEIRREIRKNGFWFVDIPRTSSSSLRAELGRAFGIGHGKKNIPEKEHATPQLVPDHRSGLQMREMLGQELWQELLTFSVVRNPWARALSFYHYRKTKANVRIPDSWDLSEYLLHIKKAREGDVHPVLAYPPQYMTCSEFLVDGAGELLVKRVIRFENRTAELAAIGEEIGIPALGGQKLNAATPQNAGVAGFYDATARDLVSEIYAEDCERFGYVFPNE